ncbi:hypothetical protein [Hyphococcus luteus]|uniref:Uncharacterized protein n=1 Tax=Hyphococcus luteus TaxID=2058213 RepID=A0A2S7K0K5_9PROT|nr:hypothetical protein [Marinicaulis flavus]PQA86032.1 hypothetical protein CW354_16765 [Marinicaulis flavus]
MFYRVTWFLVLITSLAAMFLSFIPSELPPMLLHIALFLPGGLVTIIYWLFKGEGFWGNNKALTFIFAFIPAILSGLYSYSIVFG